VLYLANNTGLAAIFAFLACASLAFAEPTIHLLSPENGARFANRTGDFSFLIEGASAQVVQCRLLSDVDERAFEAISGKPYRITLASMERGVHFWGVECGNGDSGASFSSEERAFSVFSDQEVEKSVILLSPQGDSTIRAGNATLTYAYYSGALGAKEATCYVYLDSKEKFSNSDRDGRAREILLPGLIEGAHTLQVACRPEGAKEFLQSKALALQVRKKSTFTWEASFSSPKKYSHAKKIQDVIFNYTYYSGNGPSKAICTLFIDGKARMTNSDNAGVPRAIPLSKIAGKAGKFPFGLHKAYIACRSPASPADAAVSEERIFMLDDPSPGTPKIIVISPDEGEIARDAALNFSIFYYPGSASVAASCYLYMDENVKFGFSAGPQGASSFIVMPYELPPGRHTWQVKCDNPDSRFPIYSEQRNFNILARGDRIMPKIDALFPEPGAVLENSGEFRFKYVQNEGPKNSICTLDLDGYDEGGATVIGDGEYSIQAPLAGETGSHYWSIFCTDNGGSLISSSDEFAYSIATKNAINANTAASMSDAAFAHRRATLAVEIEAYLGTPVSMLLKSDTGEPLPQTDVFVREPAANMSVKLRTDDNGKASFVPTRAGKYTYKAANFSIVGAPATYVLEKKDRQETPQGLEDAVFGASVWVALALVAFAFASAYLVFAKRRTEDDDY